MNRISPRPPQYQDAYAARFKHRSMAETYELRPPYPDETYRILLELPGALQGSVLDVGCGTGRIARSLVDHVAGVDAIDWPGGFYRKDIAWRALNRTA